MELQELLNVFLNWAWERHHNPLSWLIRPLFLIPLCYFAYRRSWPGIGLTLVALATSMFWFPAPAEPPAWVTDFLAREQAFLLSPWTPGKLMLTALVPLSLGALIAAFWFRSIAWGVALFVAIGLAKSAWSVYEGGASGWSVAPFALFGILVCSAVVLFTHRRWGRRAPAKANVKPQA